MHNAAEKHKSTFLRRLLFPIFGILVVQAGLYAFFLLGRGVVGRARDNEAAIFHERVINRQMYIENEMIHRWSNLDEGEELILESIAATVEREGATYDQIADDALLNEKIMADLSADLIYILRKNSVTGAFVILNGRGVQSGESDDSYAGLYLRAADPANYTSDNSDLLVERGLSSISKELQIPLDSFWSPAFQMEGGAEAPENAYYFKPFLAAQQRGARSSDNYGYWSASFSPGGKNGAELTYTIPLITDDGTVIGVMGVGITQNYLLTLLSYDELREDKAAAYVFASVDEEDPERFCRVIANGPLYQSEFLNADEFRGTLSEGDRELYRFASDSGDTVYGSVQAFRLYNTNTPFEKERWVLVGLERSATLYAFPDSISFGVCTILLASLLLGVGAVYLSARIVNQPITALVQDLRNSDPGTPLTLRKIDVQEIDELTSSIENLSRAVAQSASRLSQILELVNVPIGVFEYQPATGQVFCSKNWFLLSGVQGPAQDRYLPKEVFLEQLKEFQKNAVASEEQIYRLVDKNGSARWVRLVYSTRDDQLLGVVMDATQEILEKRRIEYERDFDPLTALYNRRAFEEQVKKLFQTPEKLHVAALIMWDLDNLKYLNDTYGHDCGDRYIYALSQCLRDFSGENGIAARRSGDEFYVFLYGYPTQAAVDEKIRQVWGAIQQQRLELPDGGSLPVRVSAGVAWYPRDAKTYERLLHYADFAMYAIKHSSKGNIQQFDKREYLNDGVMVNGTEALNRLIEERLVRYALQPIVETATGRVFGYEMLMRPQVPELPTPDVVLRLARAQSKLYEIERLTMFSAMENFRQMDQDGKLAPGARVFINSIGSSAMTARDVERFSQEYSALLPRLVLELVESDFANENYTQEKLRLVKEQSGMVAIDDYGSGYNSEAVLISTSPDIVKVDISLIHDIDRDIDRQAMVKNLVSYASQRGILVLAEGVETRGELETLLRFGVDLVQGYYFARPTFDAQPPAPELIADLQLLRETVQQEKSEKETR